MRNSTVGAVHIHYENGPTKSDEWKERKEQLPSKTRVTNLVFER